MVGAVPECLSRCPWRGWRSGSRRPSSSSPPSGSASASTSGRKRAPMIPQSGTATSKMSRMGFVWWGSCDLLRMGPEGGRGAGRAGGPRRRRGSASPRAPRAPWSPWWRPSWGSITLCQVTCRYTEVAFMRLSCRNYYTAHKFDAIRHVQFCLFNDFIEHGHW